MLTLYATPQRASYQLDMNRLSARQWNDVVVEEVTPFVPVVLRHGRARLLWASLHGPKPIVPNTLLVAILASVVDVAELRLRHSARGKAHVIVHDRVMSDGRLRNIRRDTRRF